MKSVKVIILILLMSTTILLGLNSVLASGVETPEFKEEACLYYNSKEYFSFLFFYKSYYEVENTVKYQEQIDRENGVQKITIKGRTTQEVEIAIYLSFNEKEETESSRVIVTNKGKEKEVRFQGIMTGIQYLKKHQLKIGMEEEIEVRSDGETYKLLIKVVSKENVIIDNIDCLVYLTEIKVLNKYNRQVVKIDLWFIKGGKLDGYIARIKMLVGIAKWLELTLNKASKI